MFIRQRPIPDVARLHEENRLEEKEKIHEDISENPCDDIILFC